MNQSLAKTQKKTVMEGTENKNTSKTNMDSQSKSVSTKVQNPIVSPTPLNISKADNRIDSAEDIHSKPRTPLSRPKAPLPNTSISTNSSTNNSANNSETFLPDKKVSAGTPVDTRLIKSKNSDLKTVANDASKLEHNPLAVTKNKTPPATSSRAELKSDSGNIRVTDSEFSLPNPGTIIENNSDNIKNLEASDNATKLKPKVVKNPDTITSGAQKKKRTIGESNHDTVVSGCILNVKLFQKYINKLPNTIKRKPKKPTAVVNSSEMDAEHYIQSQQDTGDINTEDVNTGDSNVEDSNVEDTNAENTNAEDTNVENTDAGNANVSVNSGISVSNDGDNMPDAPQSSLVAKNKKKAINYDEPPQVTARKSSHCCLAAFTEELIKRLVDDSSYLVHKNEENGTYTMKRRENAATNLDLACCRMGIPIETHLKHAILSKMDHTSSMIVPKNDVIGFINYRCFGGAKNFSINTFLLNELAYVLTFCINYVMFIANAMREYKQDQSIDPTAIKLAAGLCMDDSFMNKFNMRIEDITRRVGESREADKLTKENTKALIGAPVKSKTQPVKKIIKMGDVPQSKNTSGTMQNNTSQKMKKLGALNEIGDLGTDMEPDESYENSEVADNDLGSNTEDGNLPQQSFPIKKPTMVQNKKPVIVQH